MIALIQRVLSASVDVGNDRIAEIGPGMLILLGVERQDDEVSCAKLCERTLAYRLFSDEQGKMNLNIRQAGGSLLVVSQFTLVADTDKGLRPGFSRGAPPDKAQALYQDFTDRCRRAGIPTQTGQFAADMQVALVNDGPVTFWLQT